MIEVFDASGRMTDEAAQILPQGLFVRAVGMDGCQNLTLYKRLSLEGFQVACIVVDGEEDEVLVEFDSDCGLAKIMTEKLNYVLLSAEMLEALAEFTSKAAELYEGWRDSAAFRALRKIEEEADDAKVSVLQGAFAKTHAKTLDRWVKVRWT